MKTGITGKMHLLDALAGAQHAINAVYLKDKEGLVLKVYDLIFAGKDVCIHHGELIFFYKAFSSAEVCRAVEYIYSVGAMVVNGRDSGDYERELLRSVIRAHDALVDIVSDDNLDQHVINDALRACGDYAIAYLRSERC